MRIGNDDNLVVVRLLQCRQPKQAGPDQAPDDYT